MQVTEVVEKYIKLRDIKAKLKKEHEAKVAPLEAAMEHAEAVILAFFNENGMDSASTPAGTAYRTVKSSATVEDFDALLEFVKANDAWHFLEKRVSKLAVEEFTAETKDLPPGVKYSSMASINIRRS